MMKISHQSFSTYRLTVLALLIAAVQTSRLIFSFLPNVQPVTVLLILITITFGTVDGLIVGVGSILASNLTLGMGPWTFAQIVSYSVLIVLTHLCSAIIQKTKCSYFLWGAYSGSAGLLYGMIISIVQAAFYGMTFPVLVSYWMAGLWFDVYHAVGNMIFFILLYPGLVPVFNKVKNKISKKDSE